MNPTRWLRLLAPLTALLLVGCPTTTLGDVADKHAARLRALQADLKAVVATFPAPGSITAPTTATGLSPTPTCDVDTLTFTMDLVQVESLEHPRFALFMVDKPDLGLSWVLVDALADAQPNALSAEERARPTTALFTRKFESTLTLRYVALIRTNEYVPPDQASDTALTAEAKLDVFLIDLQDKTIKASFPVLARAEVPAGADVKTALYLALHRTIGQQVAQGLRQHAGATVVLE